MTVTNKNKRPTTNRNIDMTDVGVPWMSGSTVSDFATNNGQVEFDFPNRTRNITVINQSTGTPVRVHFGDIANGNGTISGSHFITLAEAMPYISMNVEAEKVFVSLAQSGSATVQVFAELTTIPVGAVDSYTSTDFVLTGSGIDEIV